MFLFFFFQAEDGIRDPLVTGVQTCALPISTGSADAGLYGTDADGNARTPNSSGYIVELDYLPIQKVRLTLQYTGYSKFDGAKTNYDGNGRNASDNNTLFFNVWVAF